MARIAHRQVMMTAGIAALAALMGSSAPAHHSTAMFEWGKEIPLKNATVERWDWTNPHTFLYVAVPGTGGQVDHWAFEGMSPNHLSRAGWSKRTLKAGDKINLTYYKLKDGRKGGFNISVTTPDGKTIRQLESPSVRPDNDK
jgi:hypothetical protein